MNKATWTPSRSASGADSLPSAPTRARTKEGPRTAREGLTHGPALPRATHGVGCMPTKGRSGSVADSRRITALLRKPIGVSQRVAERCCRKAARGDLDAFVRLAGRDAGAVTEQRRRSNRSCRCYARVGFLPKRGTPGNSRLRRKREPPAVLSVRHRMPRKRQALVAAGSSRGCPLKGRLVRGGCNTCHRAPVVGRDEARPTNGFSPWRAYSRFGTRRSPMLPDEGPVDSRRLQHLPPRSCGWARRVTTNNWFRPIRAYSRAAATRHDRVPKKAG